MSKILGRKTFKYKKIKDFIKERGANLERKIGANGKYTRQQLKTKSFQGVQYSLRKRALRKDSKWNRSCKEVNQRASTTKIKERGIRNSNEEAKGF